MPDRPILITGATGQLGGLVSDALLGAVDAGQIAALVRPTGADIDPRVARLQRRGVETRTGDYEDPASLSAAMKGVERLLLISSSSFKQRRTQHGNVIDAAKAAGVGFVAYRSILDAQATPLMLATDHRETEAMLAGSGLQHVFLRNGWYLENHMVAMPQALQNGTIRGAAGERRFSSAARADYADAAAALMRPGAAIETRTLEFAGDQAYSMTELAAKIARQSGRPVRYQDMAPAAFEDARRATGTPDHLATILADTECECRGRGALRRKRNARATDRASNDVHAGGCRRCHSRARPKPDPSDLTSPAKQEKPMTTSTPTRRTVLSATGAALLLGASGLIAPARAQSLAPTRTMRGGANNYRPGAPLVERIGGGGFWTTGTVRRAGDGAPLAGRRIQVWAHTTEGHERDARSHGATLTDANGVFRIEMPQIVPAFGQPHGHLAYDADYDDGNFETVFLRPVMASASDTTLNVEFVLRPA